jgi:hypothetical protein
MSNTKPRRNMSPRAKPKGGDTPWSKGDPTKRIGLNTPIGEPLMLMLDYLVEQRAISSKASFIREVVGRAAEDEVKKLWRVQEAVKRMDRETSGKR